MIITQVRAAFAAALLSSLTVTAAAQPPPPTEVPRISRETRDKMAALHEQMASCLRSDKSVAECRSEMDKDCQEQLGTVNCAMTGMGHPVDPRRHMQQMSATPQ